MIYIELPNLETQEMKCHSGLYTKAGRIIGLLKKAPAFVKPDLPTPVEGWAFFQLRAKSGKGFLGADSVPAVVRLNNYPGKEFNIGRMVLPPLQEE